RNSRSTPALTSRRDSSTNTQRVTRPRPTPVQEFSKRHALKEKSRGGAGLWNRRAGVTFAVSDARRAPLLNQRILNQGGSGRLRPSNINGSGIQTSEKRRGPQVGM